MCRVVEKWYLAIPDAKQNKFIYSYACTNAHTHTNNNYTPIVQYISIRMQVATFSESEISVLCEKVNNTLQII